MTITIVMTVVCGYLPQPLIAAEVSQSLWNVSIKGPAKTEKKELKKLVYWYLLARYITAKLPELNIDARPDYLWLYQSLETSKFTRTQEQCQMLFVDIKNGNFDLGLLQKVFSEFTTIDEIPLELKIQWLNHTTEPEKIWNIQKSLGELCACELQELAQQYLLQDTTSGNTSP
jgi:hypothetical protein